MVTHPALPSKLTTYLTEQEEVNGRMITLPNVMVSEDEEKMDENDYQEPPSEHPNQEAQKKSDDDDDQNDDPQLGQGGIQKANNRSGK